MKIKTISGVVSDWGISSGTNSSLCRDVFTRLETLEKEVNNFIESVEVIDIKINDANIYNCSVRGTGADTVIRTYTIMYK